MKLKRILVISVIFLTVFLIYLSTIDRKVYYLALGDSLSTGTTPYGGVDYGFTDEIRDYLKRNHLLEEYVNEYATPGYRTTDVARDIIDNKKVNSNHHVRTLKNALIKADLVTLSVGSNDLFSKIGLQVTGLNPNTEALYGYVDEIAVDLSKLLDLIREYCKEDILLLGIYHPIPSRSSPSLDDVFAYANKKFEEVAHDYQVEYINIYQAFLNNASYLPNPADFHPSKEGYQTISANMIEILEKTMLKK